VDLRSSAFDASFLRYPGAYGHLVCGFSSSG
jgi:hypothetical protein